jgi:Immunoglobulin domain/Immunoglobulin I-set domain/ZU5 domain
MRSRLVSILCVFGLLVALAGCGGSDGGSTTTPPPPTSNNPPPAPPPPPPPVIGANGGTATEASGASVIVPAGALVANTTIRIARDSTGSPAIPADLTASGSVYVITPHGGDFANPVEVRIPAPAVTLQPNQEFKLAKAEPGGEWVVLADTKLDAGMLSVNVDSFSFFVPVIVTYLLPIAQAPPFSLGATLTCAERSCTSSLGTVTATYTVSSNNGQLPEGCTDPTLGLFSGNYISYGGTGSNPTLVPITGGSLTRALPQTANNTFKFGVARRCNGSWYAYLYAVKEVRWALPPSYPYIAVMSAPATLDVVEGASANLDVVFGGGASQEGTDYNHVSVSDRTLIDWERSDDSGTSWRVIAHSFENEANPLPISGANVPWLYWSVRHGFVAAITDQGVLIRAHACYTPPSGAAPSCVDSPPTRLNVLQQSAVPAIVDAPRSVLIRTGQTANLSVTASGLPAPTLIWQTRAANSTGAWSDVTGAGATSANYTTPALALSDNGIQYRVLATNAVGNAASTAVTISVSDLDVSPSITTQPASLNVTAGSDAVFAAVARGTEALSYQWYRNGAVLPGANSPVLRMTNVSSLDAGTFNVRVSNSAGTADSDVATLNVHRGTPVDVAPTIVTQPAAVTVNAGNTATFAVGVDGSGPFTFQWRKDGVNIAGSTSAVLTLSGVTASSAGSYSVVVSNAASTGVTSSAAVLTVNPDSAASAPSITTQPATLIVAPGGSGILAVAATGSGPLSYQWLGDGVPIGGETAAVLFISNAGQSAEGRYAVRVSNSIGAVISTEVQVILLGAPVITQQPAATTALEGETATFSVGAGGSALRYQWLLNDEPIEGANQSSYTTNSLVAGSSGAVYTAIVYNNAGLQFSQGAVLTVLAFVPPTVTEHPVNTSVAAGSAATLCASFGGTPPFQAQMTRWSGTAWLPVLAARRLYDNAQACTTTPVLQISDNGAMFRFEVISGPGQVYQTTTNAATITVTATPAITATTLASVSSAGITANNRSYSPSLSADGHLVAFVTDGTNLVPGATNPSAFGGHAYVRNLITGVTTLINQTPSGGQSIYGVQGLKLAAGGRYAIFSSLAGDLVADDDNGSEDVFVRDLLLGTTKRVSLHADGSQITNAGGGQSDMQVDISADGSFVSFVSSQDLISNGPAGAPSLYLRSLQPGFLRRVAGDPTGVISYSKLASNGMHLVYAYATFAPARNTLVDYDVESNTTTELFNMDSSGADYMAQGIGLSDSFRYVVFAVRSAAMFNGSTYPQILAIDRNDPGHITIASGTSNGVGDGSSIYPRVSDDGHVLFMTNAPNLTGNFANAVRTTLVVRDLQGPGLTVASRRANGTTVATITGYDYYALSGDGTALAFVGDEADVSGGVHEYQVYVAPRP